MSARRAPSWALFQAAGASAISDAPTRVRTLPGLGEGADDTVAALVLAPDEAMDMSEVDELLAMSEDAFQVPGE